MATTTVGRPPAEKAAAAVPGRRHLWSTRLRFRLRGYAVAWLFLAPALLLFTYFKFIPMVRAIEMSFLDVRPYLGDLWVGAANYHDVLTSDDVMSALWHTLLFAVLGTFGSIVLGLALALLLEGSARHLWFVRTVVFLPTVAAGAVVAEVWRILYYPAPDGTINTLLAWVGLGPSQFLNSGDTALPSILAVLVWHGAPYNMMIFLAGLAGVDRSLYEAAAADGASIPRRIWHITLPALRPVFAILFTLAALRGLRIFTEVYLLTNGGPDGSTETLMTLIYKLGLERNELGVAAAGSVLLLLATAVLTLAVQAARRRETTS